MRALVCPGQGSQKKGFLARVKVCVRARTTLEAAGIDLIHCGTEAEGSHQRHRRPAPHHWLQASSPVASHCCSAVKELIFAGHSVRLKSPQQPSRAVTNAMRFVRVPRQRHVAEAAASPTGMAAVLGGVESVHRSHRRSELVAANSSGGQIVAAGPIPPSKHSPQTRPRARVILEGCWRIPPAMAPAVPALKKLRRILQVSDPTSALLTAATSVPPASVKKFVKTRLPESGPDPLGPVRLNPA